ncbi:MAG: adenosylcobinamide-GDP ribazoletransferase [Rhodobacteraceae bacterium CG17_big_fil_post_rev_8_21_14_2_50_63_15]|nr:adenosylcobinamide-GDP ribazoletransferase [Roseovarius sp.]PIV79678.1 MAG: adenosylcobinamide-GDP ribazoletransferase [Rhodobacteraceae bacterium CG17_big_fil_post_rev_8_21_14_2_50_63_15]
MAKTDTALIRLRDPLLALGLLSRLPVPLRDTSRGARAAWAYPLAGMMIGGLAALGGLLALWLGLPPPITALIALSLMIVISGALHEDGLADSADGLWGGWTAERRLEIMKDSAVGSYGVIAICLSLAARWSALWMLYQVSPATATSALIASAMLSRAMMALVMAAVPPARSSGLSHSTGAAPWPTAALGLGIAVSFAFLLLGHGVIIATLCAGLTTLALALIARARIGGQTGDILGATQQLADIAILLSLLT